MSTTDHRSATLNDKKARWNAYFRKRLGDNPSRLQAAVDAALLAASQGASSQEAAAVGIAASRLDGASRSSHEQHGPGVEELAGSDIPGVIVGRARKVQRHSQIASGGSIVTLEFRLELPDSTAVQVQMQGVLLDGAVKDGDVVEVRRSDTRGGRIVTDHVYNRSSNSEVRMRRGLSAVGGQMEAHWGRRWKVFLGIVLGIVGLFVIVWLAWVVFIASNVKSVMDSHNSNEAPTPPAWFCEQATNMGTRPPGC